MQAPVAMKLYFVRFSRNMVTMEYNSGLGSMTRAQGERGKREYGCAFGGAKIETAYTSLVSAVSRICSSAVRISRVSRSRGWPDSVQE